MALFLNAVFMSPLQSAVWKEGFYENFLQDIILIALNMPFYLSPVEFNSMSNN
jgi:hypothetical protein